MVNYFVLNIKRPTFPRQITTLWLQAVARSYGKRICELNYQFCDDEHILEVNRQFLQHDYYTDVITFDECQCKQIFGDACISVDTVRSNAENMGIAYATELRRVIVHALLHLCGLHDKAPEEEKQMRAAEEIALQLWDKKFACKATKNKRKKIKTT